ncbi:MAG: methyltransferase domain-containing protein [Rhodomicrobium sp.]
MAEEVNLEPRRFAAAASHYLAGRPAYAERLILRIVQKLPLGAADAVMDLGCGPGQLAILFAPYVGSVLAIDPSAEMLEIARHAAGEAAKIRFKPGSSFDIGPELGTFKLVTIGRAFHWMDRSDTLQRLDGMVAKGGAVALFADSHPKHRANSWVEPYRQIIDGYAAVDVQRAKRHSADWPSNEEILLASPFAQLERWSVIERRTLPAAQLVERALSMSSINEARLGGGIKQLVHDIAELASRLSDGGSLTEVIETSALIARRAQES